jgi:hypothetical protein
MYQYIHEVLNNKIISNEQHKILDNIFVYFDKKQTKTHNILMGKGKTSTITPMIVLRNYVEKSMNKVNVEKSMNKVNVEKAMNKVRIIMPDNLIDQSYKIFMKYVNIIPFLNISIFKADNPDIDFNEKYNKFFDGDETQIYVSLTSISEFRKCLIINLEKVKEGSWKEDYVIIDEIDSIIDPCKSEINLVTQTNNDKDENIKLFNEYILYKWIQIRDNKNSDRTNKYLNDKCIDNYLNNLKK